MKTYWMAEDVEAIATGLEEAGQRLADRTVLLCGGAGFLGRYLTAVLDHMNRHVLHRPVRLVVLDNFIVGARAGSLPAGFPRSAHIRFVHHDITRPIDLDEPLDFIIQAAGIASPYY